MRPALLVLSLSVNIALSVLLVRHWSPPESTLSGPNGATPALEAQGRNDTASASVLADTEGQSTSFNWMGASADDIMAELRRSEAPAQVLVLVASGLVNERYQERFHSIGRPENASRWRYGRSRPATPETRAEQNKLREEVQAEVRRLLGTDPIALIAESSSQAGLSTRFGNLPTETIARVRQIESDYDRIRSNHGREVNAELLLEQELAKDLAAVMTPEEFADYMAFNSRFAARLQQRLGDAELTDDDYLKIYAAADRFRQEVRDRPDSATMSEASASYRLQELASLRNAASVEVLAGIALEQDRNFQRVITLTSSAETPPETVLRQYEIYLNYHSMQERMSGQAEARDVSKIKASAQQTYDAFAGGLDEPRRQALDRTPFGSHLKGILEK